MASTDLAPVRTQIANVISALSPAVKAYTYPPGLAGLDSLPCGVIELPTVVRTEPDRKESELGRNDWHEEWPVLFFFDLDNAEYATTVAEETVEDFIKAIDAATDATLDTVRVNDWKVTRAEPGVIEDRNRSLVFYECTVAVFQLVP